MRLQYGDIKMVAGVPRTEEERRVRHASIYGGLPPAQRKGLGPNQDIQKVAEDLLPDPDMFPLPVPKFISKQIKK